MNGLVEGVVKSRKTLFVIATAVICIILVGGFGAELTFMSSSSIKTTVELQTPLPKGCISADQAIQIAKNYTNQYANQNNRTITDIKVVFGNSTFFKAYLYNPNYMPSESEINSSGNGIEGSFYVWNVTSTFKKITPESIVSDGQSILQYTVPSFVVSIYAYSGQIKTEGPLIIVNQQDLYKSLQMVFNQGQNLLAENYISAEQAFKIAIPYVNQYITENNRTVTEINISLGTTQSHPIWGVEADFSGSVLEEPNGCMNPKLSHVCGYYVGIWADTGQVAWQNEQIII